MFALLKAAGLNVPGHAPRTAPRAAMAWNRCRDGAVPALRMYMAFRLRFRPVRRNVCERLHLARLTNTSRALLKRYWLPFVGAERHLGLLRRTRIRSVSRPSRRRKANSGRRVSTKESGGR